MAGSLSGTGEKLQLKLSGLAKLSAQNLVVTRVDVEVGGASRLSIDGATDQATLDLSGSSMADAMKFKAKRARVVARGSSKTDVFVTILSTPTQAVRLR